jgi:hypothetical protein
MKLFQTQDQPNLQGCDVTHGACTSGLDTSSSHVNNRSPTCRNQADSKQQRAPTRGKGSSAACSSSRQQGQCPLLLPPPPQQQPSMPNMHSTGSNAITRPAAAAVVGGDTVSAEPCGTRADCAKNRVTKTQGRGHSDRQRGRLQGCCRATTTPVSRGGGRANSSSADTTSACGCSLEPPRTGRDTTPASVPPPQCVRQQLQTVHPSQQGVAATRRDTHTIGRFWAQNTKRLHTRTARLPIGV